jgi:8-oxo-dGTP pyrophosphatase MutT (NUDIX family)
MGAREAGAQWRDPSRETIRRLLQGPKPGLTAQARMAPRPRPSWPPEQNVSPRQGGVLILLYPHRGQLHLVLTRRTDRLENHKGQISLPGGRREGDEPIQQTALREAQEELGVLPAVVETLGELTPLYIPTSDFCITPVVGWIENRPHWQPDPDEVAEVVEIPLRRLADPASVREEIWHRGELTMQVRFYSFAGHRVWGATAMVLSEFLTLLTTGLGQ